MIAKRKEDREVKVYAGYGRFGLDLNLRLMPERELMELYDAVSTEITRRDREHDGDGSQRMD